MSQLQLNVSQLQLNVSQLQLNVSQLQLNVSQLLSWSNIALRCVFLNYIFKAGIVAIGSITGSEISKKKTQTETVLNSSRDKHVMILLDRTNGQFK